MKRSATIAVLGFLLVTYIMATAPAEAKPEFAAQTKMDCTFCHPKGPPELGPAGLYFKEKVTLEGYGEEIGVHLPQWDVALIAFGFLSLVMLVTYILRI